MGRISTRLSGRSRLTLRPAPAGCPAASRPPAAGPACTPCPRWVFRAPVAVERPLLLEAQAGLVNAVQLLQGRLHCVARLPCWPLQGAQGPVRAGKGVLLCEVVPAQHLKTGVWREGAGSPRGQLRPRLPTRGQRGQVPDLSLGREGRPVSTWKRESGPRHAQRPGF